MVKRSSWIDPSCRCWGALYRADRMIEIQDRMIGTHIWTPIRQMITQRRDWNPQGRIELGRGRQWWLLTRSQDVIFISTAPSEAWLRYEAGRASLCYRERNVPGQQGFSGWPPCFDDGIGFQYYWGRVLHSSNWVGCWRYRKFGHYFFHDSNTFVYRIVWRRLLWLETLCDQVNSLY